MKKRLLILGMITCILGLTGCGSKEEAKPFISEDMAIQTAEGNVEGLIQLYAQCKNQVQEVVEAYEGSETEFVGEALLSYSNASEDIGDYKGILSSEATVDEESAIVNVTIEGTKHNAVIEVIMNKQAIESLSTNVVYSFGESMEKAALNTLLGMGTVFVVLILISLIISCFKLVSVFENRGKNKKTETKEAAPTPAKAVKAPVEEENLTDDLELVAVIAAAIAASEGAASTDGLVVRSIRKANKNKWQNA